MPKSKKTNPLQFILADPAAPLEQRLHLLRAILSDQNPEGQAIAIQILETLAANQAESVAAEKARELAEIIRAMEEGPLRSAAFLSLLPANGALAPRALVALDDGAQACAVVSKPELLPQLRVGVRVFLEKSGRALLYVAPSGSESGEVVRLERRLGLDCVEVSGQANHRYVLVAAQTLRDKMEAGEVGPGAMLRVNARQHLAFDALPPEDSLSHYRFLSKEPVPNVRLEDIGSPPKFITELAEVVRAEMTDPEPRRRLGLRRCVMKLLSGVSGSGKTLAAHAFWRRMYEVVSEVTGVPVEQLPRRVFRLANSQVLSMWLGESDKNLDRFFSEVEQMAGETFVAPDGKSYELPVLALLEEVDGIAHARGHESIHDRILTTALQRLDSTRETLRNKLILFIGTTNEPHQVDRAFLRRIGGTIEPFQRLKRKSFTAVLHKHLRPLPIASHNGCSEEERQRRLIADLTAWLFSPNGADGGVVELQFAGSTTPEVRFRRDFLTGALVDRAVQQAAEETWQAQVRGGGPPGISLDRLARAFDQQIRSVAEQLHAQNVAHYLDLPDGQRVANLRRLLQPALLPTELQRKEIP